MTAATSTFFGAWGMADVKDRKTAIAESFAPDGRYTDPRTDAPLTGSDAVTEYVGMFSQYAPGAVAEVTQTETRDGVTRATIAFRMPDGMQQTGQYFITYTDRGLISHMIGFAGTGASE